MTKPAIAIDPIWLREPIAALSRKLCPKLYNALEKHGVETMGDLGKLSPSVILSWDNIGEKSLEEIRVAFEEWVEDHSETAGA